MIKNMTGRSTPEYADAGIPPELEAELAMYHSQGTLIIAGQETVDRGIAMLKGVGSRQVLPPLCLPEPFRYVVVPTTDTTLHVEAWQRQRTRPLGDIAWAALEEEVDFRQYLLWPTGKIKKRGPVFVGNIQEIDYSSPKKARWVYNNNQQTVRVAVRRGAELIVLTTTELEKQYGPYQQ